MSTQDNTASISRDVYARVTDQIVTAIEAGVSSWKMPWHTSGRFAFSPINVVSKKPYRGVNTLCLWAAAQAKGYERGDWATYEQWHKLGSQLRKGEKATTVVFWKFGNSMATEHQDSEEEQPVTTSRLLFTRGYRCSTLHSSMAIRPSRMHTPRFRIASSVRNRSSAAFLPASAIKGNRAFYSPVDDTITLPPFAAFFTPVDYYSTRGHESAHWTAKPQRCNRELGKRFGDHAYSMEELVAELTAAFVCSHLGLSSQPREDHAQYLASWLKVLKADKWAIFTAASKAQRTADYLIGQVDRTAEMAA